MEHPYYKFVGKKKVYLWYVEISYMEINDSLLKSPLEIQLVQTNVDEDKNGNPLFLMDQKE